MTDRDPPMKPTPTPDLLKAAVESVWKYSLVIESSVRRGDGPDQYAGVVEALQLVKDARAALSVPAEAVVGETEGWKLVPIEPTAKMHKAAWDSCDNGMKPGADWKPFNAQLWRAMLDAAPSAPEGESPQEKFSRWLNDGPKLAKAAGVYVGISVKPLPGPPALGAKP